MAFEPLILTGDLMVNGVDVSDQVKSFTVRGMRDAVEIPRTLGKRKSYRGGADSYEVSIDFLQDTDTTALTMIFWDALADTDGTITFGGTVRPGGASATNPRWSGTALVTSANVGGDADSVGEDSVTLPCLDRPTKVTSDGS